MTGKRGWGSTGKTSERVLGLSSLTEGVVGGRQANITMAGEVGKAVPMNVIYIEIIRVEGEPDLRESGERQKTEFRGTQYRTAVQLV